MAANEQNTPAKNPTTAERKSERELVVTRLVEAPARLVFEAWTDPELFRRWWAPKSCGLSILDCELDVRTGGSYRLVMSHPASDQPMTFFGRYLDVTPPKRIVWTNEEGGEPGPVTSVSFEDKGGATLIVISDLYPSKQALDEAVESGATSGWPEQFAQLDALLDTSDAAGEIS